MDVKVRLAPSPTGSFHIGGARTALFNYLFAKQTGGLFGLRIEDTDQKRYVESSVTEILEMLDWLGLTLDFGPSADDLMSLGVSEYLAQKYGKEGLDYSMVQSKRSDIYKQYAMQLVNQRKAYCVFSAEIDEFDPTKRFAHASKEMNLAEWRGTTPVMQKMMIDSGETYHIRAKMPREDEIITHDFLRGNITFEGSKLHDPVILKSDGLPTYHLASVVDDHLMGITHVIRNEEWIASLPIHFFLYNAFGWEPPIFVHTGSILNPSGKGKMSKRLSVSQDGKTAVPTHVQEYKKQGFLPEAMINMIALTGWNPGNDIEYMDMDQMIQLFDLKRINRTGAAWNYSKLLDMNRYYLSKLSNDKFAELAEEFI